MIVDLDKFSIGKADGFDAEIMIKANDDELDDWMMPLMGAFESTFEMCSIYAGIHDRALKKNINLRHFSLYKQEQPIVSITLSLNNGIVRIDDVGTLPELQGKRICNISHSLCVIRGKKTRRSLLLFRVIRFRTWCLSKAWI